MSMRAAAPEAPLKRPVLAVPFSAADLKEFSVAIRLVGSAHGALTRRKTAFGGGFHYEGRVLVLPGRALRIPLAIRGYPMVATNKAPRLD